MVGQVVFWNQSKGFGFLAHTTQKSALEAPNQKQYFFHHSHFTKGQVPVQDAFVVFALAPSANPRHDCQAVGVRFATTGEIAEHLADRKKISAAAGFEGLNQKGDSSPKVGV